jgi:broad specificity phosphatase PhoE
MKIGMIRHGKVQHRDPFLTTADEFEASRKKYYEASIETFNLTITPEAFPVCYVSSLKRTQDTAKIVYLGKFQTTDELIEIPNRAFFLQKIKIPTFIRAASGRIGWFVNSSKVPETRKQSDERATKFLSLILKETDKDVLLVTHGFFMHSLAHALYELGFKGHLPLSVPNVKLFVFEK